MLLLQAHWKHFQCPAADCCTCPAVPYTMLPKLLQQPTWRCPLCGGMNQCTLDPKVADQLMVQYRVAQQHGEVDALPDLPDFDSPTMTSGSLYPAGSSVSPVSLMVPCKHMEGEGKGCVATSAKGMNGKSLYLAVYPASSPACGAEAKGWVWPAKDDAS